MEAGGTLGVFDQQDCRCGVLWGTGGAGVGEMEACQKVQSAGERGLLTWSNLALAL